MSRSRNALTASLFTFTQFALGLASGFLMLPVILRRLGAYDNGLWLASGEVVGYLALSEFGVFAVLPWLVAALDGRQDRGKIGEHLSDAIGIGCAVSGLFLVAALVLALLSPEHSGIGDGDFLKIRGPLLLLLLLTAVAVPLRAFGGVLAGLQDNKFIGSLNVAQTALTIALTVGLILSGYGMYSLAAAAGLPPLVIGLAMMIRTKQAYPDIYAQVSWPDARRCRGLVAAGVGPWLSSMGTRLLTASSGLVYASLGRPNFSTLYAATGKVANVAQPICCVVPDSGLVGLSQLVGNADQEQVRRTVTCLLSLYLVVPGFVALGTLIANPWFIPVWLGEEFYASDAANIWITINMVVSSAVGGLFKVVAVVGHRTRIGVAAVVHGVVSAGLGYALAARYGIAGFPAGMTIACLAFAIPYGFASLRAIFGLGLRDLFGGGLGRWALFFIPMSIAAAWLGIRLRDAAALPVCLATAGVLALYVACLRPVFAQMPWPEQVRSWLTRLRLIPRPTPLNHATSVLQ